MDIQFGKYGYIVEADIKGFFDNINHDWLIRMLEQRIQDRAFIRLIKKWLKAGILDKSEVKHPVTGTPQGGIISPILANIYLHYVIDLWMEKVIKPRNTGMTHIVRYADDFVCAFQYKHEAEQFLRKVKERLLKFGLETAEDKTKLVSFSRFRQEEKTSFDFLGFEFRWGYDRKGLERLKRRTSRKKLQASIKSFREWIKVYRNKRINIIFEKLNAKLRGYYNYYGIRGNSDSLELFFRQMYWLLFKWLNRRSQRRSFNLQGFEELLKHFRIEMPRITEKRGNGQRECLV